MSKEMINLFAERGYLLNPGILERLEEDLNVERFLEYLEEKKDVLIVDDELLKKFIEQKEEEKELEEVKEVEIMKSFNECSKKIEVNDFVNYFKLRYNAIKEILQARIELKDVISINRVRGKNNEKISLIGMVNDKKISKNENIILELEDLSGKINVIINKNRWELYNSGKEIVLDEVVGIIGNISNNFVFVDNLFFPEIPVTKEFKKSPREEYVVFISDTHVGNKDFLGKEFQKFLDWINGKNGNHEQKSISEKIKYLFIVGDLIEGVGIYPGQEKDLEIKDYYKQYKEFARLMEQIPKHINLILCPGNHDALRLDEPQPAIGKELLGSLLEKERVYSVSNPAWVRIGRTENFPGFEVLVYHGGSFNYYADAVESIRLAGGQQRADLIMKFLLKKRHLAPTHTSISYFPGSKDNHVIEKVPDFFVSGHIHRCSVANYHNINVLDCSCWIPQSDYEEKQGLVPEPARAIIVNLQTREVKILNFEDESEQKDN